MSMLGSLVPGTVLRVTGMSLRAELEQLTRQLEKLRHKLKRSEEESADLRKRLKANRRHARAIQPDDRVLEQVLPLRHAALIQANHDGRSQREVAFMARSTSYRESIATLAPRIEPTMAGGLSWCLPDADEGGALS